MRFIRMAYRLWSDYSNNGCLRMETRQRARASFSHVFYTGCHQKVQPRFQVAFPTSEDPDLGWVFQLQMIQSRKILHRCAQPLGFQLIPDVVKLTTKNGHHNVVASIVKATRQIEIKRIKIGKERYHRQDREASELHRKYRKSQRICKYQNLGVQQSYRAQN